MSLKSSTKKAEEDAHKMANAEATDIAMLPVNVLDIVDAHL